MSNTSIPISVNVQKGKLKRFKEFLKSLDYVNIDKNELSDEKFVRGNYVEGEKLKSFAGIWKGNPIDANQLRKDAWQRGKRK